MSYPLYIIFGVLPSIIWLLFYLRKDSLPESNKMIIKVFIFGIVSAAVTVIFQIKALEFFEKLSLPTIIFVFLNVFVAVAFLEEFFKYLVVKITVLNHSEFDEPVDAALYMIIAALGFAAAENILILISLGPVFLLRQTLAMSIIRFCSATFLHALCSGILGYFLALSIYDTKKRARLLIMGLLIATLLHGFYNFSIMKLEPRLALIVIAVILISLAIFLTFAFKKLKKMKSVSKIQ